MSDARATYLAGQEARSRDVRDAEGRARSIGTARVLVAVGAVGIVVALVWGPLGEGAWWGVGAAAALFVALVVAHGRVHAASERAAAGLRFHERGLARLGDRWSELAATGERFASAEHPYTDDLDVFGPSSLFQRIDCAETRFGEERLADWLTAASEPVDLEVVRARQSAVKDLAPRVVFRERFSASGSLAAQDKPDPAQFLVWAEGGAPFDSASAWAIVAWVLPLLVLAGVLASIFGHVTGWAWGVPLIAERVALLVAGRQVAPIAGAVSSREGAFARFGEMLALVAGEPFEAPLLRAVQARLRMSGAEATVEMARLQRVLGFLDARNNEVWRFFIGPTLMWDIHCVVALERWRVRAGKHTRPWLEAIGDVEALASLAGLAFEQPDYVFPEIGAEPRFDGAALGHPLIAPGKRVVNDVALKGPGTALVITGSNMSGKSTLLRAIGVNAILALAGGPVCARRLVIGPVRVAASMRVRDSLAEGVSRFYAEVRKLKAVIDRARSGRIPATLFLLDEVLHGTNSRERLIGARAIVRELVSRGALGGVSTHDLALGDMETELPGAVVNVHFEEQVVGDTMTFDYQLRPGVVHSSNALRIMRMVGIDVVTVEGGDMISFDEAERRFLALGIEAIVAPERVAIDAAAGRVLAEELSSRGDLPPFDYSAMDGYAVSVASFAGSERGPWTLPVLGESRTGGTPDDLLPGCACRIFTGAPIPKGADAVVMQERVVRAGDRATFDATPKPGAHIRRRGEDLARGAVAIARGTRLRASHVALAATCDRAWVEVARRPLVTILSTGDELRPPGAPAVPGREASIPESNGVALRAMAVHAGATARIAPIVGDDRAATERAIGAALEGCDVLVTVGGVSVGDHDWVRPALESLGVTLDFWKVAIKPGKPLVLGRRGRSIVVGLPGNPASAMITFALFGLPLLRAMQGDRAPVASRRRARCAGFARAEAGRMELVRVALSRGEDGEAWATPLSNQASGASSSLAHADALLVVPSEATRLAKGDACDVLLLAEVGL